jgi:hypothetical protein
MRVQRDVDVVHLECCQYYQSASFLLALTTTFITTTGSAVVNLHHHTAFADERSEMISAETQSVNSLFCHACTGFLASPDSVEGVQNTLDEISQDLVKDIPLRWFNRLWYPLVPETDFVIDSIWDNLSLLSGPSFASYGRLPQGLKQMNILNLRLDP